MKHAFLFVVIVMSISAHAGGTSSGGFRDGGVAFQGEVGIHHKIKVIKVGDKYAEGLYYVDVLDTKTKESYVMLLTADQIFEVDNQQYVETDVRSNSL